MVTSDGPDSNRTLEDTPVRAMHPDGRGSVILAEADEPSPADDEAVVAVRLLGVAAALYGVTYLSGYVLISQGLQRMLPRITATALA